MPSSSSGLRLREAVALGLLHGPAELLPISSSGHVTVVPWLLGWDYPALEAEERKAFEVALHAGTAVALAIALRGELRLNSLVVLSAAPPAAAGYLLERPIKRHLGTPLTVAVGLLAGALAMALADRVPERREATDAGAPDALWLGLAQACALFPGVSRNGATLAVARWRGFGRGDAARLSWQVALAPIAGATVLEALRVRRVGASVAAGAAAAFVSTLASRRLLHQPRPLRAFAMYRCGLAAVILARAGSASRKIGTTR
jgi:undecaprenyl-diphosphatase